LGGDDFACVFFFCLRAREDPDELDDFPLSLVCFFFFSRPGDGDASCHANRPLCSATG